jgi:hypothetical protein
MKEEEFVMMEAVQLRIGIPYLGENPDRLRRWRQRSWYERGKSQRSICLHPKRIAKSPPAPINGNIILTACLEKGQDATAFIHSVGSFGYCRNDGTDLPRRKIMKGI